MATKDTLTTIRFYEAHDVDFFDVDNRPLRDLRDRDNEIADLIDLYHSSVTIPYASSVALDFASVVPYRTISVTGNMTLTSTNRSNSKSFCVRIVNSSGSARTLSVPSGWVFLNSAAPTTIASGKTGVLSLTCFGTAETDVVAVWAVQL